MLFDPKKNIINYLF